MFNMYLKFTSFPIHDYNKISCLQHYENLAENVTSVKPSLTSTSKRFALRISKQNPISFTFSAAKVNGPYNKLRSSGLQRFLNSSFDLFVVL